MNKKFILYKITYLFRKMFQICIYVHKYFFIFVIFTKLNQFYLGLGLSCLKPQKNDAPARSRLHDNSFLPSLYCSLCPFGTSRLYLAGKTESASWKTLLSAARFMFQFCISFFLFLLSPFAWHFLFLSTPKSQTPSGLKGWSSVGTGGARGLRAAAAAATKLVWLWLCQRERGPSAFGPLALWCLGEQSEMARVGERGGG